MANILHEDGIEVLLDARALRVEQATDGRIQLTVRTPTEERTLSGLTGQCLITPLN